MGQTLQRSSLLVLLAAVTAAFILLLADLLLAADARGTILHFEVGASGLVTDTWLTISLSRGSVVSRRWEIMD